MNEIEQKALALVNEVEREDGENELTPRIMRGLIMDEALCRAIEQHEAFRQEVSSKINWFLQRAYVSKHWHDRLNKFIIPKPKPDPLVEAMADCGVDRFESWADKLRAALDARGFEIREKNDD